MINFMIIEELFPASVLVEKCDDRDELRDDNLDLRITIVVCRLCVGGDYKS